MLYTAEMLVKDNKYCFLSGINQNTSAGWLYMQRAKNRAKERWRVIVLHNLPVWNGKSLAKLEVGTVQTGEKTE